MLGMLISLLTGCAKKEAPPPNAPGVSVSLQYPVLLIGNGNLIVKDNEEALTTTTAASGLNLPEYKAIDSTSAQYSIRKVTPFGQESVWLNMGTKPFRLFLEMKEDRKISLEQAKTLVRGVALEPNTTTSRSPHGSEIAMERIQRAQSVAELIEVCRKSWEWR